MCGECDQLFQITVFKNVIYNHSIKVSQNSKANAIDKINEYQ